MKILICGLPGSGKSTLAELLSESLPTAVWINADIVRTSYNDWDFSLEGRLRQAQRMKHLADGVVMAGKIAIADFICPTEAARTEFNPDYVIWMDTITEGRFADTNAMFENPTKYDYHVTQWFDNAQVQLLPVIERYMKICKEKA